MLKFGVSNLRRLYTVDPISIKPITLLVGRNSSGKSTYLRTFPLLRQSLMTRTSSPILWYGDLVDFGSFDTSLSREPASNVMSFSFYLDEIRTGGRPTYIGDDFDYVFRPSDAVVVKNISVRIDLIKQSDRVRISEIAVYLNDLKTDIRIELNDSHFVSRLLVNGVDVLPHIAPTRVIPVGNSLLPEFRYLRDRGSEPRGPDWVPHLGVPMAPLLVRALRRTIDQRIKDATINNLASRLLAIGIPDKQRVLEIANSHGKAVGKTFHSISLNEENGPFRELTSILYAAWFPELMRGLNQTLRSMLTSTLYIGPARARSERYYRYQDLAVSEIDPDGKNFPMFLNSLSRRHIAEFSGWIESLFGYGVAISRQAGHISILLTDGPIETNIVDVGYGVSQILPVLAQIWWAKARPPSRERTPVSLLAIEQPELHLHPAHQALLADALVGEFRSTQERAQRGRMHYLVETHSETLVNRFGEFISSGRLASEDVQVVLFEPDESGVTRVRTVHFDKSGALVDWPFGFFQPAVY